jgi:tetratricopeptide (TPR) repeat protein
MALASRWRSRPQHQEQTSERRQPLIVMISKGCLTIHLTRGMAMKKWIGRVCASLILMTSLSFAMTASAQQNDRDVCFKGSGQEAIAACTRRISQTTGNNLAVVYHSRGYEYMNLRQFDMAIADFTQSIRVNPSYINPYVNRCLCYRGKGDFAKAVADANSALRIDRNDKEARICLERAQKQIPYPTPE